MSESSPSNQAISPSPAMKRYDTSLPIIAQTRKTLGWQPRRAIKYLAMSLRNPNDAVALSRFSETTLGARFFRNAAAFVDSPTGRQLYSQESDLSEWLDDRSLWKHCGPETLAAHYLRFMERRNTTAIELRDLSRKWRLEDGWHEDRLGWYIDKAYSLHDVTHVLFGYDFDVLGEMCLMACLDTHYPSLGITLQLHFGVLRMSRNEPYKGYTRAALLEAYRNGSKVPAIWEQNIRKLMAMDLSAARESLGIVLPSIYLPPHADSDVAARSRG